jgi:NitT/TauT family transport system ATP-binding protein
VSRSRAPNDGNKPALKPKEDSHDMEDKEIVFDDVSKRFDHGKAVSGLTFSARAGELVAIVGKTGSGKSTAFNMIMGLMRPTSGSVRIKGRDPYAEFEWFRGKLAVVFQDDRLLPWRTALGNVCLGLEFAGVAKEKRVESARQWLERLGLGGRENSYPYQLSGGMRQRVSIARAFALDPSIILCDEAFSALDELTAENLRREFVDLVRRYNKTGVFITHSIPEALEMGERVLVFRTPGHVTREVSVPGELTAEEIEEYRAEIRKAMADTDEERATA